MTNPQTNIIHARSSSVEVALARVLRIGVWVAVLLMLIGCAMYIFSHGRDPVQLTIFSPRTSNLGFRYDRAGAVIQTAVQGTSGAAWMQAGVLVLLATPTLRVIAALLMFIRRAEYIYVLFALIVLAALAVGLSGYDPVPAAHHTDTARAT